MVSFGDLFGMLRARFADFAIWLFSYLGGMVIMYLACFTIWFFHKHFGPFVPGYAIFLVTGTICLAATGVSYTRLNLRRRGVTLSPLLSYSWPFLIMGVYGVLVSAGVKQPSIPVWQTWAMSIFLFSCLMIWSAIIWLHMQGIRIEMESEPEQPAGPADLSSAADNLPQVTS